MPVPTVALPPQVVEVLLVPAASVPETAPVWGRTLTLVPGPQASASKLNSVSSEADSQPVSPPA